MRIDYNIHLDYSDVLLHPKRSTLSSRRDVDILRKFKFRNSGKELSYVPIMASNMDGVGTFSMARVLQEYKMLTVIRKHYTLDDWKHTWMGQLGDNVIFISAIEKSNIEELKKLLYSKVREIHVTRFPYNNFLYPEIN